MPKTNRWSTNREEPHPRFIEDGQKAAYVVDAYTHDMPSANSVANTPPLALANPAPYEALLRFSAMYP